MPVVTGVRIEESGKKRVPLGAREVEEANASHRGGRELADGTLELAGAAALGRRRS